MRNGMPTGWESGAEEELTKLLPTLSSISLCANFSPQTNELEFSEVRLGIDGQISL